MRKYSEFLSYDELQYAVENDGSPSNYKNAANLLLTAVNDYPAFNLKEPTDLVEALRRTINNKLTFENLTNYAKSLSPEVDAWKMEAINSLLKMFEFGNTNTYNKTMELDTIILHLTHYYRQ